MRMLARMEMCGKSPKGVGPLPATTRNAGFAVAHEGVILQYHSMRTELVTTLKRQATDLLADIERDREPILITQHGLPSAYLVDVESYELMQARLALLEGIARGESAIAQGRTVTHDQAKERLARWLE